jgi:hypothetical protein
MKYDLDDRSGLVAAEARTLDCTRYNILVPEVLLGYRFDCNGIAVAL